MPSWIELVAVKESVVGVTVSVMVVPAEVAEVTSDSKLPPVALLMLALTELGSR